jgi:N-acetylmuramoyl-L-alanine amidase
MLSARPRVSRSWLRRVACAVVSVAAVLVGPVAPARALDLPAIPADFPIDMSSIVVSRDELVCLALNDYWEARSEEIAGRIAVARVVLNRSMDSRFPSNLCDVVKQTKAAGRCQFSWYCDDKANVPLDPKVWRDSLKIAAAVLQKDSAIPDPTGGALWYHASFLRPNWAAGFESTTIIGQHVFYREMDDMRRTTVAERKPFIYRLNAFAEFATRRNARVALAMAAQAVSPVSSEAVKSSAVPVEPVAR